MTERVRCNAPTTEGGICTRLTYPGLSCGFHDPPGLPRPTGQDAPACTCERPFTQHDEDGEARCLWCGKPTAAIPERRAA